MIIHLQIIFLIVLAFAFGPFWIPIYEISEQSGTPIKSLTKSISRYIFRRRSILFNFMIQIRQVLTKKRNLATLYECMYKCIN